MAVIQFESRDEKREKKLNDLREQEVLQHEETEALLNRIDMKRNSGASVSEEDVMDVFRSMAKGRHISKELREVRCEDPELKKSLEEGPQTLVECWKSAIHSGEKMLTPFPEIQE